MAEPSYGELKERLAELAELERKAGRAGDLEFKVGEKGGVSVYGLGRFPVTLFTSSGCACWTPAKTCRHSRK